MQWQKDGELDRGDLAALVDRLRAVEPDRHVPELGRLKAGRETTD